MKRTLFPFPTASRKAFGGCLALMLWGAACGFAWGDEAFARRANAQVKPTARIKAPDGYTQQLMDDMEDTDPYTHLRDVESSKIKIRFFITQSASRIVEKRAFDVSDEGFDLEKFVDKLSETYQKSLDYFSVIYPDAPIQEVFVFVTDFGSERKSSSARAKRDSLIIELDVRRWHKNYRGSTPEYAWQSAIHEFAHVVNYRTDAREDKYHRELSAIFFEMLNYIKFAGWEKFEANYLELFFLKSKNDVLSDKFID